MNIIVPDVVQHETAESTEVLVNVFAGSDRSRVEIRFWGSGDWQTMDRVFREDPSYVALKSAEESDDPPNGRGLPRPVICAHLWKALLPFDRPLGTHLVHVRTTDMFGQSYEASRSIRIEE
jgi:hypothetical protein